MKNSSKKLLTSADWDIDIQACSATDCTGLIPALPETDAEFEHYQDLYHYLIPRIGLNTIPTKQDPEPTL